MGADAPLPLAPPGLVAWPVSGAGLPDRSPAPPGLAGLAGLRRAAGIPAGGHAGQRPRRAAGARGLWQQQRTLLLLLLLLGETQFGFWVWVWSKSDPFTPGPDSLKYSGANWSIRTPIRTILDPLRSWERELQSCSQFVSVFIL